MDQNLNQSEQDHMALIALNVINQIRAQEGEIVLLIERGQMKMEEGDVERKELNNNIAGMLGESLMLKPAQVPNLTLEQRALQAELKSQRR